MFAKYGYPKQNKNKVKILNAIIAVRTLGARRVRAMSAACARREHAGTPA